MARRNTVEVIITAKDKASKKLSGLDKAVGTLQKGFATFAVAGAAKAAFELGKLGAQSLRTKSVFAAISGGAENAARNLEAMQVATRGTISDMKAMQSANQLMQMGLANNADELGRVTEMAVRLGTAMGRDASESIESFALLLANQSIPRLDTFGISAGKTRTRILELMAATEGMTRETAFMTAVMEEGDKAMERLGEETDDAATKFAQFEARIENAKITIAEQLAPAIAGFLDLLATGIAEIPKFGDRLDQLAVIIEFGALKLLGLNQEADDMVIAFLGTTAAMEAQADIANMMAKRMGLLGAATSELTPLLADGAAAVRDYRGAAVDAGVALGELEDHFRDTATAFGEMEFDDEELWKLALASGANTGQLIELAKELGIATQAEITAALKTQLLIDQFEQGEISARDLALANDQLARNVFAAELATENATVATDDMVLSMGALIGTEDSVIARTQVLTDKLNAIPRSISVGIQARFNTGDIPAWARQALEGGAGGPPGSQGGGVGMGLTRVGEGGPELVNLPPRSRVFSNEASRMITNNNRTANLTINTSAPHEPIIDDFRMMESFMGA